MPADKFYGTVSAVPKPPENPRGLLRPGNINIYDRPIVPNHGALSTIYSTSFGMDDGEVLVPRVSDGADGRPPHIMSNAEAMAYYKKTGQNLGTFDNYKNADIYGERLHEQQAQLGSYNGRTSLPRRIHPEAEPTPPVSIVSPMQQSLASLGISLSPTRKR